MTTISLLNWMLLSTVLLGAWWLCYRLLLRSERSFVYNRVFLVLGPVLAVALPLLPLGWPATWVAGSEVLAEVASVQLPSVVVGAKVTDEEVGVDWAFWTLVIYLTGAVFMLVRLGWELGQLWLTTRPLVREPGPDYTLVRTHGELPTSSFGNTIFWDESLPLSPAESAQVLRHELAHVQQGHTYDRLLLELLQVVLWFNPFVHLCGRALALTHEFLADEAALRLEAAAPFSATSAYAHLLARQVATRLGFSIPLAHTFSHSQTLHRIAMIKKTAPIRRWKQWLALPLVAASLFTVAACEQASEPVTPTQEKASQPIRIERLSDGSVMEIPREGLGNGSVPAPPEGGKVYVYVENMPHLPSGGGAAAIVQAIQKNLVYPTVAVANRKSGRVFVSFTVLATGEVDGIKTIKGLAPEYDGAVVKAVQALPRFVPGMQGGNAVAVSFTVPITFEAAPLPGGSGRK